MAEIILKQGREKSLLRYHPWIFSGAIERVIGVKTPGETVDVISKDGQFLAKAAYNQYSQISARVWSWDPAIKINTEFFEIQIKKSIQLRESLANFIDSDALRLIHGESDGIPGLILDQYNDIAVVQFLTAGIDYWREEITQIIQTLTQCKTLFERSDVEVRKLEGLENRKGILFGSDINSHIKIHEKEVAFLVDIENGHKTGFYLDQRENRLITGMISNSRKVLDCFAYSGGFAVNTLVGGAENVILVDSSSAALKTAAENFVINHLDLSKVQFIEYDVFKYLRILRDRGATFDLIILDPPKFAPTASQAERASRGYKDINLLALKLLNRNGFLLTFSCSGGISEELFQKIVAGAASDCAAEALILKRLYQAIDHPVALNFPEGAYLKGFLIQKLN